MHRARNMQVENLAKSVVSDILRLDENVDLMPTSAE